MKPKPVKSRYNRVSLGGEFRGNITINGKITR
jgi:hypothetical protein